MISKFNLGAVEWSVEINNERLDDRQVYGNCSYHQSKIEIQDHTEGKSRTKTAIDQTLYHEVVHAILDTLGEHDLSNNEEFVQKFSLLLHQFETTKK